MAAPSRRCVLHCGPDAAPATHKRNCRRRSRLRRLEESCLRRIQAEVRTRADTRLEPAEAAGDYQRIARRIRRYRHERTISSADVVAFVRVLKQEIPITLTLTPLPNPLLCPHLAL